MRQGIGFVGAFLLGFLSAQLALAQSTQPAAAPTTQPDFPKQILSEALDTFQKAPKAKLDIDTHVVQTALDPINNVGHQALINERSDDAVHISWVRPSKLAVVWRRPTRDWRLLFDGTTIAFLVNRGSGKTELGFGGVVEECVVDDVFAARGTFFGATHRSAALVLEEGSYKSFFKYAGDFKWLGAGRDNGVAVWQIAFTDAEDQPWQMSITQAAPRRIVRIVNERDSVTGIEVVNNPNDKPREQLTRDDIVFHTYKVHVRSEFHFRNWDNTAADDNAEFKIPDVKLEPQEFFGEVPQFAVGDHVEITPLETADGIRIEPSEHNGLLVISFWRHNDFDKDVVPEKLAKLIADYKTKGVKWLAIDAVDRTAKAKAFLKKNNLAGEHIYIAPTAFWRDQFKVDYNPGAVMIAEPKTGKLLYYGTPGYSKLELLRFKEALDEATSPKPVTQPATAPSAQP